MDRRHFLTCCCAFFGGAIVARSAESLSKPKVRAIAGFIALDPSRYEDQIETTLQTLRAGKRMLEAGNYAVESIRIVTQPFPEYVRSFPRERALQFFQKLDTLAAKEAFDPNIGPAMLRDDDNAKNAELLGEILSTTKTIEGSLVMAAEDGIYWKCIGAAAKMVKFVEEHSPGSMGNFNFTATAMLQPYAPFYPGGYHVGPGQRFTMGTEAANVVADVFGATGSDVVLATQRLTAALAEHAIALEKLAVEIEKETGWTYMGLDPTPAPLRDVSIGAAIEKFTGAKFGSPGTMTAAAVITKCVQSVPVKRVGYSGLMLPILEDSLLAQRWSEGTYGLDSLLAYSAVCGTGLDTIPIASDVPQRQIERIFGDVASLAFKWKKPLSARLLPVKGKAPGERTEFNDPFLVNAVIQRII
jgi:uncharacterized protein